MADWLHIITDQPYVVDAFCIDHDLSRRDPRIVRIDHRNHYADLRGHRSDIVYVLEEWTPSQAHWRAEVMSRLTAVQATRLVGPEIDRWLREHPCSEQWENPAAPLVRPRPTRDDRVQLDISEPTAPSEVEASDG